MQDPGFKRFGKYEIQTELGRGGFGRVFRAFDPTVGRLVAIKILSSDAGGDMLTRFRTEAMAAGNLRHENIVTIYEFGEEKGVPFIAMEYLEGEDLQQVIAGAKPPGLLEKVSIMAQTAAGLDCAHRHGVVHRDVKPANIRVLPNGGVKLMDFGIARLIREDGAGRLTRQGHVIGTLLYMSPEQVMGSDTDSLSDVFAYGVTFYELLAGRHPFHADDPRSIFYKITSEDPEPIHRLAPDCPEILDRVIRRALQKDRELRYHSLDDLRLDVEPVLIELRRERSASLRAGATRLIEDSRLEDACSLLNQAIDLDPANTAAREMRNVVRNDLRRQALRPRIEALVAKATQSVIERRFTDAVQELDAALRLDPENTALQARSREAQEQRDRFREANRLRAEARADLARGDLAPARRKASESIALRPDSAEGRELLELIQIEADRRERERRRNELLAQARKLIAMDAIDEATQFLESLAPDQRETAPARELLARAAARKAEKARRALLARELDAARKLMSEQRFAEVIGLLQNLQAEYPGEPEIADIESLAEQELAAKEQAIARALDRAATEMNQGKPEEAVAVLEAALARYSDARLISRVDGARQAVTGKRRAAVVKEVELAVQVHVRSAEFDRAHDRLEKLAPEIRADPAIERLRDEVRVAKVAWEAQRERDRAEREKARLEEERRAAIARAAHISTNMAQMAIRRSSGWRGACCDRRRRSAG